MAEMRLWRVFSLLAFQLDLIDAFLRCVCFQFSDAFSSAVLYVVC